MMPWTPGYRTKFGAAALILSGVAVLARVIGDGDVTQVPEGLAAIGAGLAALGIRFAQSGT